MGVPAGSGECKKYVSIFNDHVNRLSDGLNPNLLTCLHPRLSNVCFAALSIDFLVKAPGSKPGALEWIVNFVGAPSWPSEASLPGLRVQDFPSAKPLLSREISKLPYVSMRCIKIFDIVLFEDIEELLAALGGHPPESCGSEYDFNLVRHVVSLIFKLS